VGLRDGVGATALDRYGFVSTCGLRAAPSPIAIGFGFVLLLFTRALYTGSRRLLSSADSFAIDRRVPPRQWA
jgi:hypothetical protein